MEVSMRGPTASQMLEETLEEGGTRQAGDLGVPDCSVVNHHVLGDDHLGPGITEEGPRELGLLGLRHMDGGAGDDGAARQGVGSRDLHGATASGRAAGGRGKARWKYH